MSILKYMLADQEAKEKTRENAMDFFRNSNTYKMGAGIGNLAKDAASGIGNFASDITFNPLPYGEYARGAYDGMQNLYGNTLDKGLDNVIDYFNPKPDMMANGPLSRNGGVPAYLNSLPLYKEGVSPFPLDQPYNSGFGYSYIPKTKVALTGIEPSYAESFYDANMPGTMMVQDNFVPISGDDRVYYQETDTGPGEMTSGPLSDKSIDQIISEYNEEQKILRKNYNRAGDRIRGDR